MPNGISLVDLGKLSEPITKAIEAISNAVGKVYEPFGIVKKADADAKATVIHMKGQIEADELKVRALRRVELEQIEHQKNIENILAKSVIALDDLRANQSAGFQQSESKPEEDWVSMFFENCKNISNEQMHQIWARLLAKEVNTPGKVSRLTLNTLKVMTKIEADLFSRVCSCLVEDGVGKAFILPYKPFPFNSLDPLTTIPFDTFDTLDSYGLLHPIPSLRKEIRNPQGIYQLRNVDFEIRIQFNTPQTLRLGLEGFALTSVGEELSSVCKPEPDRDFQQKLFDTLKIYPNATVTSRKIS